jgi:hypothetical protein
MNNLRSHLVTCSTNVLAYHRKVLMSVERQLIRTRAGLSCSELKKARFLLLHDIRGAAKYRFNNPVHLGICAREGQGEAYKLRKESP